MHHEHNVSMDFWRFMRSGYAHLMVLDSSAVYDLLRFNVFWSTLTRSRISKNRLVLWNVHVCPIAESMTNTVIFQCACAKLPYFYFRSEICRHHRAPRCWNMAIFRFSRWRPYAILNIWCACLDHPRRAFSSLYCCAKFGWNRHSSFDNRQVLIFCDLGLKTPIHATKIGSFGAK